MRPIQNLSRAFQSYRVRQMTALFLVCVLGLGGVFAPHLAHAQTDFGIANVDQQIGLSGDSIVVIILRVIRILLGFLGLVLVILMLYAGYTIMTSAGNEEKVEQGKKIIRNAVIGTAIILFSFIIVQFAMNILGNASGNGGINQDTPPGIQTFTGVGSLGRAITDHYPRPNQTGVYRNTKIVITFRDDIDPSSFIENSNGTCWGPNGQPTQDGCNSPDAIPYYGDCVGEGSTRACDTLITSAIEITKRTGKQSDSEGAALAADALVSYESGQVVHTVVLKPLELLGNAEGDQWHRVTITDAVNNQQGNSIFDGQRDSYYQWEFETNTEVDLSPPYVVDISPDAGSRIEKNTLLKITFNEPVDPMVVQGQLGGDSVFSNLLVDIAHSGEEVVAPSVTENSYNPQEIGTIATPNVAELQPYAPMRIDNNFLYVAFRDMIQKIDISNLSTPTVAKEFAIRDVQTSRDIAVDNTYLYSLSSRYLVIFNKQTGEQINQTTSLFTSARRMIVAGGYAYVTDSTSIKIVDVTPSSPTFLQNVAGITVPDANIPYLAFVDATHMIYGDVASQEVGLIDISTPANPRVLGRLFIGQQPRYIVVRGTYAYVAYVDGIKIIDLSNLAAFTSAPIQDMRFNDGEFGPNAGQVKTLMTSGDRLLVQGAAKVKVFSFSNSINGLPGFLFAYPGIATYDFNKVTIAMSGNTMFVNKHAPGSPISIVDIYGNSSESGNSPESEQGITVSGRWQITNGYKTVEFISDEACGMNSCGDTIYCLPTGCDADDESCTASYAVLARTASLEDPSGNTFVSAANVFNGVRDLADNAMDNAPTVDTTGSAVPGSHDFAVAEGETWRHRPFADNSLHIRAAERVADNFWWQFTVENRIDTETPYVTQVFPGIDQEGVGGAALVDVYFSREMAYTSLTGTRMEEYPAYEDGVGFAHDMETQDGKTHLMLVHPARPFGPNGTSRYYFTSVPGSVTGDNQMCMYPGRGPDATAPQLGISEPCVVLYNSDGSVSNLSSCVPGKEFTNATDTGCVATNAGGVKTAATTEACLESLKNDTISPIQ